MPAFCNFNLEDKIFKSRERKFLSCWTFVLDRQGDKQTKHDSIQFSTRILKRMNSFAAMLAVINQHPKEIQRSKGQIVKPFSFFQSKYFLIQKTNSFVHNLFVYNVWHCHRQQKLTVNWPVTIAIYVSSDIFSFSQVFVMDCPHHQG